VSTDANDTAATAAEPREATEPARSSPARIPVLADALEPGTAVVVHLGLNRVALVARQGSVERVVKPKVFGVDE
jgi:hypothetical protein